MRALFIVLFALILSGCEQPGMTHAQWQAEQAKKARMNQIKREATEMSRSPTTFTREEQERASAEQKNTPTQQK